jgi:hypothetical protein
MARPPRKLYPSRGPTITAGIRFFGNNAFNNQRFMIEDGGVPDLLAQYKANMKNPTGGAKKFTNPLGTLVQGLDDRPFDNLMPWFSQGRDEPAGKFTVEKFFFGLFGDYTLKLNWSTSSARKGSMRFRKYIAGSLRRRAGRFCCSCRIKPSPPIRWAACPWGRRKTRAWSIIWARASLTRTSTSRMARSCLDQ